MSSHLRACARERALEGIRGKVRKSKPRKRVPTYPLADPPQYGDTDYKARGGKIITMRPDAYLALAPPLEQDEETLENVEILSEHITSGREIDPPMLQYKDGVVVNHDGRHRAQAARELGIRKLPVLVYDD